MKTAFYGGNRQAEKFLKFLQKKVKLFFRAWGSIITEGEIKPLKRKEVLCFEQKRCDITVSEDL